jgi:hypothetical protein
LIEQKETAFHNWYSITDQRDDEATKRRTIGDTKTILGFTGTDIKNQIYHNENITCLSYKHQMVDAVC